ncbi:MAG: ATP-binding protein [Paludibacteraceae bacterium]|nr:ATP-binding protein [Paludibacteraceae bacterium]
MKTLVVNLYAGPGAGKSTMRAGIFERMKNRGYSCEEATEYAKDKTWENNSVVLQNQIYVFGKQHFRISRLLGKVDVVITDSPLLLSLWYGKDLGKEFKDLVISEYHKMWNLDIFVKRTKPYNPKGRGQTEEEANEIDKWLERTLPSLGVKCKEFEGDQKSYEEVLFYIFGYLESQNSLKWL